MALALALRTRQHILDADRIGDRPSALFRTDTGTARAVGASLGHFASNYGYYFIVSSLPFYLVKSRGFSMGSMVAIASWAYLLNALSALAMGWLKIGGYARGGARQ